MVKQVTSLHLLSIIIVAIAIICVAEIYVSSEDLSFDEAYNLNLVKTIAVEGHYATHTATGYRAFDPAVTTGPSMLLPMALGLKLWGVNIDIVRLMLKIAFFFEMALIFICLLFILDRNIYLSLIVVLSILSLPLVLDTGLRVLGEMVSITFLILSLTLLFISNKKNDKNRIPFLLASGIAMGMAELAKDISIFIIIALVLIVLFHKIYRKNIKYQGVKDLWFLIIIGFFVPVIWRIAQLLVTLFSGKEQLSLLIKAQAARADILFHFVLFNPFSHVIGAINTIGNHFFIPVLLFFIVSFYMFNKPKNKMKQEFPEFFDTILFSISSVYLFWFIFLSGVQANARHLLPGIIFAELLIARQISNSLDSENVVVKAIGGVKKNFYAFILLMFLILSIFYGFNWNHNYLQGQEARFSAQLQTAAWVRLNISEDESISGWGWFVPWDIAFLSNRIPSEANINTFNLDGLTDWFVLTPELSSTGNYDDRVQNFISRQGIPAYKNNYYKIYHVRNSS